MFSMVSDVFEQEITLVASFDDFSSTTCNFGHFDSFFTVLTE